MIEANGFAATSVDPVIDGLGLLEGRLLPPLRHQAGARPGARRAVRRRRTSPTSRRPSSAVVDVTDPVERALGFVRFFEDARRGADARAESGCLYLAVLTERELLDRDAASESGPRRSSPGARGTPTLLRAALGPRGPARRRRRARPTTSS